MTCGIYCITNTKNGKRYIGSAVNIERRWNDHRLALRKGMHPSRHLLAAWKKYKESAFRFEIITSCERDELLSLEQFWIDSFQSADGKHGYNLAPTAGNTLGVKHTAQARANMSAAHIGYKPGPETRAKMAAAGKGRKFSVETRAKIGDAHRGKKLSDELRARMSAIAREAMARPEVKAKISATSKGRKVSDETRAKHAAAMVGKIYSPELRAKISAGLRGRKYSNETKEKISTAAREAWSRPEVRATMLAATLRKTTTKLNEDDVRRIRELLSSGLSQRKIAKLFGVSRGCISDIQSGRTWDMVK